MSRSKSAGKKKKTGRKPDFTGKRLALLQSFAPQWQQAADANTKGDFYNKITSLAIRLWGYCDNYSQQEVDDTEEDEPVQYSLEYDDDDEGDDLDTEESERQKTIYNKLRTVRILLNFV